MTNEIDEMLVRRAKDAEFHKISLKLHPVRRPMGSRVADSLAFQQLSNFLEVDAIASQAKRFGLQELSNLKTLSNRFRRQRTSNPVRTRGLGYQTALMQPTENVADDGSADSILVAKLRLDNTKFAKNQTSGDGGFHLFIDNLPKTPILKRGIDFLGDAQTELANVTANWRHRRAGPPDQIAAPPKTATYLFLLHDSQLPLHRCPPGFHAAPP